MRLTPINKVQIFSEADNPLPETFNIQDLPPLRRPPRAPFEVDDIFYQLEYHESVIFENDYAGIQVFNALLFLTKTVSYQVKYAARKYPDKVSIWRIK